MKFIMSNKITLRTIRRNLMELLLYRIDLMLDINKMENIFFLLYFLYKIQHSIVENQRTIYFSYEKIN